MQVTGKKIVVLATGGTIAGTAAAATDNIGYTAAGLIRKAEEQTRREIDSHVYESDWTYPQLHELLVQQAMAALRSNEVITKAVLTLRKAGKTPLEFPKITIEQGRLTGLTIDAGDKSGSPDLFEELTFTFNKINVEYTPQGKDGQGKGSMMFEDQWESA